MTGYLARLRGGEVERVSALISRSINHCSHAEAVRLSSAAFRSTNARCAGVRRIVKGIFVSGMSFDHLQRHTMSAISHGVK